MGTPPDEMGKGRDWNVDLIPKFLMANGKKLIHYIFILGLTRFGDIAISLASIRRQKLVVSIT